MAIVHDAIIPDELSAGGKTLMPLDDDGKAISDLMDSKPGPQLCVLKRFLPRTGVHFARKHAA
ncbi:hypothetical protein NB311A_09129 [Nitrobacter sp. Nb-311A]|uniref:hypothetical protein n=1 Tax=unclassified Nitrobacter TaxID=2620411 RepID=UPI0000687443|nr:MULTISPECIES: hypothetical protein [unclassified Nitrobacter]EAQ33978.1 hypothetical protein NB311A_09129 [Nitrobacter sp. Nb-311A]MCV0388036.1 hypothetical protein [Nitrobacter sp.]